MQQYKGHSLYFAIWFFNNTYNQSVYGISPGKTRTVGCPFVKRSYWCTHLWSPVTIPKTGDLPSSNFLSVLVHQSTLPHFCSSLRLSGPQRTRRFLPPRQSRRMRVRLPDEIFVISCVSAYGTYGSLSRDSTRGTFSRAMVVDKRPQLSSSPNVLASDMNCLKRPKTVALDGVSNNVLNFESTVEKTSPSVVIIRHSSKIPSRKVNSAARRHVTISGHVVWNENGYTESKNIFCNIY